jgi:hypothetical protein
VQWRKSKSIIAWSLQKEKLNRLIFFLFLDSS